jgi:phosphohistidine phosphatase
MSKKTQSGDDLGVGDRILILMRHAKSDWSDESLSDRDRTLNDRGRRDAPRMARWLDESGLVPDMILSSASQRTRETAELMTAEWSSEPTTLLSESLYLATPDEILRAVRSDACDARRLMVLAHNPGMAHLISHLSGEMVDMPTAAIAVFQIPETDWSNLGSSTSMSRIELMKPKAL